MILYGKRPAAVPNDGVAQRQYNEEDRSKLRAVRQGVWPKVPRKWIKLLLVKVIGKTIVMTSMRGQRRSAPGLVLKGRHPHGPFGVGRPHYWAVHRRAH